MPIYEYQCKACGGEFEYQQRMSDDPKTVCESCGGNLERLISRSSFLLKGSGWYKDLYASPKPSGADSSASDSTSTSAGTASKGASSADKGSGSADKGSSTPAPAKATAGSAD